MGQLVLGGKESFKQDVGTQLQNYIVDIYMVAIRPPFLYVFVGRIEIFI